MWLRDQNRIVVKPANLQVMDGTSFSLDVVPQSATSWDFAPLSSVPQEGHSFVPFYNHVCYELLLLSTSD